MFCLASCKFSVQRCKEATGRVVTWRSGVAHSFTLEATFCGSNLGPSRYGTSLQLATCEYCCATGGSSLIETSCKWAGISEKLSTSSANVFTAKRLPNNSNNEVVTSLPAGTN